MSSGGDVRAAQVEAHKAKVLQALGEDRLSEAVIKDRVGGNRTLTATTLRTLHSIQKVKRTGEGKKGNPFLYERWPEEDQESSILDSIVIDNPETQEPAIEDLDAVYLTSDWSEAAELPTPELLLCLTS